MNLMTELVSSNSTKGLPDFHFAQCFTLVLRVEGNELEHHTAYLALELPKHSVLFE